jgi:hypothetical protein
MVHRNFARQRIFHPTRWPPGGALDQAFGQYRLARSYREAWEDLVLPHILASREEVPRSTTVRKVYDEMRHRVRLAVERELLGRSTDAGDPYAKLARNRLPPPSPEEKLEFALWRWDCVVELASLPEDECRLVVEYFREDTDREALAECHGMRYEALRKRVERIRKRLKTQDT